MNEMLGSKLVVQLVHKEMQGNKLVLIAIGLCCSDHDFGFPQLQK